MCLCYFFFVFFFKQKTAYEMRISDWSSDVCSSDLGDDHIFEVRTAAEDFHAVVRAVVDLDMVDLGARTDARRGQALQLLVGAEDEARIADLDIGEAARIVRRLRTAVKRV